MIEFHNAQRINIFTVGCFLKGYLSTKRGDHDEKNKQLNRLCNRATWCKNKRIRVKLCFDNWKQLLKHNFVKCKDKTYLRLLDIIFTYLQKKGEKALSCDIDSRVSCIANSQVKICLPLPTKIFLNDFFRISFLS